MDRDTVEVYEREADRWRARRGAAPALVERAAELRARSVGSSPVADLGCGPGWYTEALGPAAVALDAARAMLDQVPAVAPSAWRLQGDLSALPFRRGSLGGAWAVRSYVHLARAAVPLGLHDLHRSLAVGAPIELVVFGGDKEYGTFSEDEFAGRRFSTWPRALLADVMTGAGFDVHGIEVEHDRRGDEQYTVSASRARSLADTVGPEMRVLVCGLNPSVYAADAGVGFGRPGNRFWPAARASGLVTCDRDPVHALVVDGVGMTDLVKRATPRADELRAEEYVDGLARLERLVAWLQPGVVAFVGLAGWRAAVDRRATPGPQPGALSGRPVYVLPSTSGANASSSVESLTDHLRAVAGLAG